MGEYADMVLEGLLDEETGEYIGDTNKRLYGDEAPGFPISHERDARERAASKVNCPYCNKRVKAVGLSMHVRDVHANTPTG